MYTTQTDTISCVPLLRHTYLPRVGAHSAHIGSSWKGCGSHIAHRPRTCQAPVSQGCRRCDKPGPHCCPPGDIGDPHRFRAGGKIRSGPQVGKMATSPLPYRGSPPLQSGGQNQKWPTSGQNGYLTPAVSGIPTASQRGGKIRSGPQVGKVATSPLPYRGSPPLHSGGAKSEVAHKWAKWLRHPCPIGDPHRFRAGGKIRSGPQVGKVATSPLPYRGSPPLQSGGQNQKWPTSGQNGYLTPAVSGIPTASRRGGKIRSGPQVCKVATSPLPYRGSPPLQSGGAKSEVAHKWAKWLPRPCRIGDPTASERGGQNQKWPTSVQSGYLTPAVSGIPTASERGGKIRSGPQVGKMATSPLPYRGSPPLQSGGQNQKWPTSGQSGYLTPAVSGIPTASERGGKIRSGPQVGKVATSPLPYRGSPPLQSGGQNQKWPTSGQNGYLTPAVSGIPPLQSGGGKIRSGPQVCKVATSPLPYRGSPPLQSGGAKSEVAHKWAKWLPHTCRIGDPHRFRGGGKIRSGPQVGKMATSPLPYRGAPPPQSGGQNQKWPTSGQSGYLTPAVSGIPTASERGAKSEVAHKWAKWLPHPCRIGDPHRFRAGGKIRSGPQVRKVATSPLPYRGSPPLQSGGQNQKWPTGGQNGYLTPAVSGIPTALERGGKIRSGPQVGKVATSPLPYRGSPPLQSGGQNQKWPTSGQSGYLTPAVSGIPTTSERGAKSEMAHKWARWLPHPCRIGDPHRFRAGGQNQKWPTSGQSGYLRSSVTPNEQSCKLIPGFEIASAKGKASIRLHHNLPVSVTTLARCK